MGLTHLDNVVGDRFTLECLCPNQSLTGLSVLHMTVSACGVSYPELEQHKFLEESRKENENTVSTRGGVHEICTRSKAQLQNVQRCRVIHHCST